jgi:cation:H+ antiporter
MIAPALVFVLSGAVVILAGIRLSRDSDAIAERTGIGRVWIGAILVAAATSLPEMTTDVYAVRQGHVNLAVGDLFGSSMANMLILALVDLATRHERVLAQVARGQVLVGTLAISLTAIAGVGVLASGTFTVLGVGWAPLVVAGSYLAGVRLLYANREVRAALAPQDAPAPAAPASLSRALVGFGAATLAILVAARFLAGSAAELADLLGISTGLMGITLLALTTSLPEAVVALASVRAGAHDLAVGNLLGSNCFNMAILLVLDVADGPGALLMQVEREVLIAAFFAILLTAQALLDALNTADRRAPAIEPGPWLLIGTYAAGVLLAYVGTQ